MNKKDKIILIGVGIIASDVILSMQKQHPDHEVIVCTPEEHAARKKQNKIFERPPISFIKPYEMDFVPEFKVPKFVSNGGPMGAIERKRKW